jgi:hypothetical protein
MTTGCFSGETRLLSHMTRNSCFSVMQRLRPSLVKKLRHRLSSFEILITNVTSGQVKLTYETRCISRSCHKILFHKVTPHDNALVMHKTIAKVSVRLYDGWRAACTASRIITTAYWFPAVRMGILRRSGCYLTRQISSRLYLFTFAFIILSSNAG